MTLKKEEAYREHTHMARYLLLPHIDEFADSSEDKSHKAAHSQFLKEPEVTSNPILAEVVRKHIAEHEKHAGMIDSRERYVKFASSAHLPVFDVETFDCYKDFYKSSSDELAVIAAEFGILEDSENEDEESEDEESEDETAVMVSAGQYAVHDENQLITLHSPERCAVNRRDATGVIAHIMLKDGSEYLFDVPNEMLTVLPKVSALSRSLSQLEEEVKAAGLELPEGKYGKKELVDILRAYHWEQGHGEEEMPEFVEPMLLRNTKDLPEEEVEDMWENQEYYVEQKRDGARIIVDFDSSGTPRAYSRNVSVKTYLPGDVTEAMFWLPNSPDLAGYVFDGEIISTKPDIDTSKYTQGKGGVTGNVLQAVVALLAIQNTREAQEENGLPLRYVAYDILKVGGEDVKDKTYEERRQHLVEAYQTLEGLSDKVQLNESVNVDKKKYYEDILARGGEGVVFKHKDLKYQPGKRPKGTYKQKAHQELDCLVTGVLAPKSGTYLQQGLVGGLTFSCKDINSGEWIEVGASSAMELKQRQEISEQNEDGTFKGVKDGIIGEWIYEVTFRGWSKNYKMVHATPSRRRDEASGAGADAKSKDDCTFDYEAVKESVDAMVQEASIKTADDYYPPERKKIDWNQEVENWMGEWMESNNDPETVGVIVRHRGTQIELTQMRVDDGLGNKITPTMPAEEWKEVGVELIEDLRRANFGDWEVQSSSETGCYIYKAETQASLKYAKLEVNREVSTEVPNVGTLYGDVQHNSLLELVKPDGGTYEIKITPAGKVRCNCTGFGYRGTCKHSKPVEEMLPEPERIPHAEIEPLTNELMSQIEPVTEKWEIAGSFRRNKETSHDIDVIIVGDPLAAYEILKDIEGIRFVNHGAHIIRFYYKEREFDFIYTVPEEWGSTLLYRSGTADYVKGMRGYVKRHGGALNEHGLYDPQGTNVASETEEDIFEALGIPYVEPEARQTFEFPDGPPPGWGQPTEEEVTDEQIDRGLEEAGGTVAASKNAAIGDSIVLPAGVYETRNGDPVTLYEETPVTVVEDLQGGPYVSPKGSIGVVIKAGISADYIEKVSTAMDSYKKGTLDKDALFRAVVSTNVHAVDYLDDQSILKIQFKSVGMPIYEYYEVPKDVYDGLLSAASKGSYVWHHIRQEYGNDYEYQRIASKKIASPGSGRMTPKESISPELAKKYEVPEWALNYNGIDAPEGGVFVSTSDGVSAVGDIINNPYGDDKVLVIYDLGGGEFIATRSHNRSDNMFFTGSKKTAEGEDEIQVGDEVIMVKDWRLWHSGPHGMKYDLPTGTVGTLTWVGDHKGTPSVRVEFSQYPGAKLLLNRRYVEPTHQQFLDIEAAQSDWLPTIEEYASRIKGMMDEGDWNAVEGYYAGYRYDYGAENTEQLVTALEDAGVNPDQIVKFQGMKTYKTAMKQAAYVVHTEVYKDEPIQIIKVSPGQFQYKLTNLEIDGIQPQRHRAVQIARQIVDATDAADPQMLPEELMPVASKHAMTDEEMDSAMSRGTRVEILNGENAGQQGLILEKGSKGYRIGLLGDGSRIHTVEQGSNLRVVAGIDDGAITTGREPSGIDYQNVQPNMTSIPDDKSDVKFDSKERETNDPNDEVGGGSKTQRSISDFLSNEPSSTQRVDRQYEESAEPGPNQSREREESPVMAHKIYSQFDYGTVQTQDIPNSVIAQIKKIQKSIPEVLLSDREDEEGWVSNGIQKLFHITVLYGTEDKETKDIQDICENYKDIEITATKLEYFESEGGPVLVVLCDSDRMVDLHKDLKGNVSNQHSFRNYRPHITVAYLRDKLEEMPAWKKESWDIKEVEVSNAKGEVTKVKAELQPIVIDFVRPLRDWAENTLEIKMDKDQLHDAVKKVRERLGEPTSFYTFEKEDLEEIVREVASQEQVVLEKESQGYDVEHMVTHMPSWVKDEAAWAKAVTASSEETGEVNLLLAEKIYKEEVGL